MESNIERVHVLSGAIKDEAPGWYEVRSDVPDRSERVRSVAERLVQLGKETSRSEELRRLIDKRLERQGCSAQAIPLSLWLAAAMGDSDRVQRDWELWCRNVNGVTLESIDELTGDLMAEVDRVNGKRAEYNSDLAQLIDRSLKGASSSVANVVSLDCVSASCLDRLLDRLAEEGREEEFVALATIRLEALKIQATASERESRIGQSLQGINAVLKARGREDWMAKVPVAR